MSYVQYTKIPLPERLGIAEGSHINIINNASFEFEDSLPVGARIHHNSKMRSDIALAFVISEADVISLFMHAQEIVYSVGCIWIASFTDNRLIDWAKLKQQARLYGLADEGFTYITSFATATKFRIKKQRDRAERDLTNVYGRLNFLETKWQEQSRG